MTSKQAVLKSLEKQKNVGQTDEAVAIKKEWLAALDGLFDKIANWLKDATKRKLLEIRPVEVQPSRRAHRRLHRAVLRHPGAFRHHPSYRPKGSIHCGRERTS